jgi:hypothetical protein
MNKRQKEVIEEQLHNEEKTIASLKNTYKQALKDCEQKIRELSARTDMENLQSIIYQKQYQEALKAQLEGALSNLQSNSYATVSDYLTKCYRDGYTGVMYDLQQTGIPIIMPIDQAAVVRAIQTDSKLSKSLYDKMGEDMTYLKKAVRAEVSRGIANGSTWNEVAGKLSRHMANTPFQKAYNNSIRIARTEGHRIQVQSALDAQMVAKSKGADIVKQWDSTLDGNTRDLHRLLDGQIREIDEPFEAGGIQVDAPGMFGDPAEDCNCRCCLLQRARWALDDDELQRLKDRAEYFGLDKTSDFEEYKEKYLKVIDEINPTNVNGEIIQFDWKDKNQLREKQQEIISDLSNEYRTRLQKVTTGAKQSAGNVDMSGAVMRLSDSHVNTAVHEFAHTLANSAADKYGLTNDADFWKEIKKIQREYHRDVDKTSDTSRWISSYEHSSRSVDEFFAEAFTQAKMSKLKLELPPKYGADLTYSNKVLEVIDKYFNKKSVANVDTSAKMITGARILDPDSKEATAFAKMYYREIKSFSTDCKHIANNIGKTETEIQSIKDYLFNNDSFEPDCAIAQSWQRLMSGKDIKDHDKVLIEHELYEMKLKKENKNMSHTEAHAIATRKYDYQKGVDEYYGNLGKNKKDE